MLDSYQKKKKREKKKKKKKDGTLDKYHDSMSPESFE